MNSETKPINSRPLFDVVAVNHETSVIGLIAQAKTERNANAVETMSIMRRGCDEEFFAVVSSGSYKEGAKWEGVK